jgi:hypothetical protein
MGGPIKTLGSVMMPMLLKTRENETVKVVLYAMVVPRLTIPVFISQDSWFQAFGGSILMSRNPVYTIRVGDETFTIDGIPYRSQNFP